jgi:hypothetical protein
MVVGIARGTITDTMAITVEVTIHMEVIMVVAITQEVTGDPDFTVAVTGPVVMVAAVQLISATGIMEDKIILVAAVLIQ